MAKITDPDLLAQGIEVDFITGSKLIKLNYAGDLDRDGVSFQALYSFAKEEWKNDDNLIKFPFPITSITAEQFELKSGWNFSGSRGDISGSQALIRDGGWAVLDSAGDPIEQWMNITTLGTFAASTDKAYYLQTASATPTDFLYDGPVNEAVQIYASASRPNNNPANEENFSYLTQFKAYLREQGKTYGFYDLTTEQGLSTLTYRKFALPLTTVSDVKITGEYSDANVTADVVPYNSMTITYSTESFQRSIGGTNYNFHVELNAGGGTTQQLYAWVQQKLRSGSGYDIDSGTEIAVTGSVAEELLVFVGDQLVAQQQLDINNAGIVGGVYVTNYLATEANEYTYIDDGGTPRNNPFTAAGTIAFNDNLRLDPDGFYKVFYTTGTGSGAGNDFGTQNAVLVTDFSGDPITGSTYLTSSTTFDYAFDTNQDRGDAASGSVQPYTAVALGLSRAQYVVVTGEIARSTTNTINFVAELERNYSNPA